MNKVMLIAHRELGGFFTTWMGYIIGAASLFIYGLLFMSFAVGDEPEFSAVIISRFFRFGSGVCMVAGVFLAMRLLAEERQTGTMVLFFTSPVTERQIVYGKFLSAFVFFGFLQALTLYMPALVMINGKVSIGHIASGYLGMTLIGSAVLAIVLFASAVAQNQLIAAVLGGLMTVTLLVLWMVSAVVDTPFKELFNYIALFNEHFQPFGNGIVHLEHVIYYLSVIFISLECAVRALEARRWRG